MLDVSAGAAKGALNCSIGFVCSAVWASVIAGDIGAAFNLIKAAEIASNGIANAAYVQLKALADESFVCAALFGAAERPLESNTSFFKRTEYTSWSRTCLSCLIPE